MNIKQIITPFDKGFSKAEHRAGSRPFNSYQRSKPLKKWLRDVFRNKVPQVFAEGDIHLCSARGKWDLRALLEQESVLGDFVVKYSLRSQSKNPQKRGSLVMELLLMDSQQTYIYVVEDGGYDLSVISSDADVTEQLLLSLREKFLPAAKAPKKRKAFFNLINVTKNNVESKRIKMQENYQLASKDLNLHYGDKFADWEEGFIEKLGAGSQGLTILRGDPGTGKTYFIRHLISRLRGTHIFYLINLTDFDLLTSPNMVEFWSEEMRRRDHKFDLIKGDRKTKGKMRRVIIIEDAERLLSIRTKDSSGSVSELLNMCDGLLGDFLQVHLVCTANCPVDDFDPAVVRSGRLTAMKEFVPLDYARAREIAGKIGVELEEGKQYTLAEIYNQTSNGAENVKGTPKIGFME